MTNIGTNANKIILIVDDDESVLSFLSFSLKAEGFQVLSAKNAEIGMAMLEKTVPHLVLLDIMLPQMDGFAMCQKMRKNSKLDKVPVLFITAYAEKNSLTRTKEVGAQGLIEKPIMFDELLMQVMDALAGQFSLPTRLKFSPGN